ncbi:MAG: inositol monophosphatase [Solirubrobacterales bacterium]|nr:inositol monophosphatase [Solirubrobacterales bacterium]
MLAEAELLLVAREAAEAAAAELLPRFGRRSRKPAGRDWVRAKTTPTDLVSDADVAAEGAIRSVLSHRRPNDALLAEESGASGSGALRWLVDPLDGTINFLFGIPAFGVSVACEDSSGTVAGLVLDPLREEYFEATRSGPATLNGEQLWLEDAEVRLELAMVGTGFGYDAGMRARQAEALVRVLPRVRDIRRVGAAALDLAWTACGRFDAYYERGLKPWDLAAGSLIAERAGLAVRALRGQDPDPAGVIAAPLRLIDELQALVEGTEIRAASVLDQRERQ